MHVCRFKILIILGLLYMSSFIISFKRVTKHEQRLRTIINCTPLQRRGILRRSGGDRTRGEEVPGSKEIKRSDPWKILIKKLDKTKDSSKFGKAEKPIPESMQVDDLKCRHFGTCSGCSQKGVFQDTPIVRKAIAFFKAEGIPFNTSIGKTFGWRTHAKLAVQPLSRWGGLRIGLYRAGSHDVEPIPDCRVHHPRINEAVEELRTVASDVGVKAYQAPANGLSSQGELRYLQLSVERESNKVQLVLVWNADSYKEAGGALPRLVKQLRGRPDLWHSVSVNFQTADTNVIFNYAPKSWKLLWGPPTVRERIGRAHFFFRPQVFRQANLDHFESGIIPAVVNAVPEGATVAELYAGLGVLGLNLVHKSAEVLCSDRDSTGAGDESFDRGADSLPEADRDRVFYEPLSAAEAVAQGQLEDATVLVVDPPRKGLDRAVLEALLGSNPEVAAENLARLVYVSCGFDALERDIKELQGSGRWRLVSAEGFVMFPGSDHIETVAVLDRVQRKAA